MKLADITPAPWNARSKITDESVKELADDIEKNGLIERITVWKDADGKWICIAGNRRLAALKSLHSDGFDGELPKDHYNVFGGDENGARALTFRENHHRKNLTTIEEAEEIAKYVANGKSIKTAASELGVSESTARRRARMATLTDEWKSRAGEMDADALEKIATYPADVQKRVAKVTQGARSWANLAYSFDRESKDLDAAKFPGDECRQCLKRTGVEADLFGITDGDLGRCLDCKCFEKHRKAWEDAEIKRLVGDAEVVKVGYQWELDSMRDGKAKRDKKHPCAYVYTGGVDGIAVKWGESAKAKKAREEAEAKASAAEREAKNADRERADEIVDRLKTVCDANDEKFVEIIRKTNTPEANAYKDDAAVNKIDTWHNNGEWVEAIDAFPALLAAAKVSKADAEWLRDYAERN